MKHGIAINNLYSYHDLCSLCTGSAEVALFLRLRFVVIFGLKYDLCFFLFFQLPGINFAKVTAKQSQSKVAKLYIILYRLS